MELFILIYLEVNCMGLFLFTNNKIHNCLALINSNIGWFGLRLGRDELSMELRLKKGGSGPLCHQEGASLSSNITTVC